MEIQRYKSSKNSLALNLSSGKVGKVKYHTEIRLNYGDDFPIFSIKAYINGSKIDYTWLSLKCP